MTNARRNAKLLALELTVSVLALVSAAPLAAAAESEFKVVQRMGVAYPAGGEQVLYREIHRCRWQDGRPVSEKVIYRDANGRRIAVKSIDYRQSLQAPAFHLVMESVLYEEGLTETNEGLSAFFRPVGEFDVQRRVLDVDRQNLVADAGFDQLIRRELETVISGKTLTFRFLVPSRLESYAFRARKVAEGEMLGEPAVHIRFEPDSVFMRWLTDPIDVWYHRETRRLLRYVGPSNLRQPDGHNARVRVDFPDAPVIVPSGAELQSASRDGL